MYYHFGDWVPVQKISNNSLVSSYAFLRDIYTFVNMSELLHRTDNVQKYSQFYQQLAEEWHRVFYNLTVNGYTDGSQSANILSLTLPTVVPNHLRTTVLNSLINSLVNTGYFTGGIISVAALYPLLSNEGYHDLALKLALSTSYPSYGYMFNNQIQNATTTWEQWNSLPTGARSSLNHHMFNSIGAWFYRYLAGIELNALNMITIHPRISYNIDLLNYIEAEVITIKGAVRVKWTRMSINSMDLLYLHLRTTVLNSLINSLVNTGYFTGGIISVAALYPLLSNEGYHDLALKLALSTSYPSYGYMFNNQIQNATTTWEQWNSLPTGARSSLNHHMFNSIGAWFYRYLAGIELNALNMIIIHPRISYNIDLLNYIEAEVITIKGAVRVKWTRVSINSIELVVAVPNNMDANILFDPLIKNGQCLKLICDAKDILMRKNRNDKLYWIKDDVRGINDFSENYTTGTISIRIASGQYTFMTYWH
ncbi:unnamed protein product [Adineta steineri]|uniref:alpha-L-rhamnosidase n=1 Tax=Adineta steineri TaxID=433720 RepID=A0A813XDF9_9BILA|nr:unnamed protein product [Adineta steineri]